MLVDGKLSRELSATFPAREPVRRVRGRELLASAASPCCCCSTHTRTRTDAIRLRVGRRRLGHFGVGGGRLDVAGRTRVLLQTGIRLKLLAAHRARKLSMACVSDVLLQAQRRLEGFVAAFAGPVAVARVSHMLLELIGSFEWAAARRAGHRFAFGLLLGCVRSAFVALDSESFGCFRTAVSTEDRAGFGCCEVESAEPSTSGQTCAVKWREGEQLSRF
jgi:hypothetical protein